MRGMNVLTQPRLKKSRYWGMTVTCPGSIIVLSKSANSTLRPAKRNRPNPYATIEPVSKVPTTEAPVTNTVFLKYRVNGILVQASLKLRHCHGRGGIGLKRGSVMIWVLVFNEVESNQNMGRRKISAIIIAVT